MRKIDVSILILIILGMALGAVIARAQSLSQEQQQGAQDKINADIGTINQITQDEMALNSQYQSAYSAKDSQINSLQQEIYLLNSWLYPPSNQTENSSDNSTTNMDVQGTINEI